MSKTLKILSRPKGNAEEYGRWSVNAYLGCSHNCSYCYLKKGPGAKTLGGCEPKLKKNVIDREHAQLLALVEIKENEEQIRKDGGLFMSFTTDPCLPETIGLFSDINIYAQMRRKLPVTILTKCAYMEESKCPGIPTRPFYCTFCITRELLAIGWTLTGHDELEPNAAPNEERIRYMKMASEDGFKTWASIEPVIDFPSALAMVYQAVNAGCGHFKIGLLTNNTRLVRKDFAFGEHKFKAYDVIDCLHFIEDVMRLIDGRATVYWKQSVRDLLGTIYSPAAVDELLDYPHSVGKDWNMFQKVRTETDTKIERTD